MKILLPVSLAICAVFTGCLPPPPPYTVVAPGPRRPHPPGVPAAPVPGPRPGPVVAGVRPPMPALRVEVMGRPPFPGARWAPGHWVFRGAGWVWIRGHWARRY